MNLPETVADFEQPSSDVRKRFRVSPVFACNCSYRRLHCEDGAEAGLALRNALVGLCGFGQWIGFNDRFDFSLSYVIQGFVKIFGAILLAADDFDALEEQLDQRDRKRFRVGAHNDEPSVRAQTLNRV